MVGMAVGWTHDCPGYILSEDVGADLTEWLQWLELARSGDPDGEVGPFFLSVQLPGCRPSTFVCVLSGSARGGLPIMFVRIWI